MDKLEARRLAQEWVDDLRRRSYGELRDTFLRKPDCQEITADSGIAYQRETEAYWDGRKGGHLRVTVSVDDGGWRSFCPVTDDFIIAPDGSFVGE